MTDSNEGPSTSKQALELDVTALNDDEDLTLNIKNEEADIASLGLPRLVETKTEAAAATRDDENIPKIDFKCAECGMHELVHYYGKTPPFVDGLKYFEDTYVMRDPFEPPPPRWKPKAEYYLALGANCSQCQRTVCLGQECSFYWTSLYCVRCAELNCKNFPLEAQARLRKHIALSLSEEHSSL